MNTQESTATATYGRMTVTLNKINQCLADTQALAARMAEDYDQRIISDIETARHYVFSDRSLTMYRPSDLTWTAP